MELTELKFAVNTEELTTAVKKLEALGVAVSDYNKVNGDRARTDRESAAAARELAKEQKAQEKATKKAAAEAERLAAAQKKLGETAGTATDEISPLEKLLEKLNNQYGDLVEGFTKGEASILQQARSFGAAEKELEPFTRVLEKIKGLTKDPFDASVGAIRSVRAEFDRLTERSNLTAQGISLTTKQLSEYSRLVAETFGKVTQAGLDPTQGAGLAKYNTMLAESQAEYLKIAGSVNRVTEEEKQRNAVLREQEKLAASTLRAQQRALEENATSMNQAVAEFRRLEKAKADAAQSTADRIIKANAAAAESATRLNQIAAMVQQGISEKEASKRVGMASQGVSTDVINQVIAAEKNLAATRTTGTSTTTAYDAAAKELIKAQKALATEEQKMVSVVASLNEQRDNSFTFNEKAARSIFNYEQNLKKSGVSAQEAAAKLAIYKNQQQQILAVEQKRQAEYLKRGLQPQVGDVVVSLAAGQNPLTVLLQQGDQIRGLIAQTGIEGEQLRKVMQSALGDTVKSIQQTAVAMGSVLVGAISSAGKSIAGLVTGPIAALITGFREANAAGSSAIGSIGTALSSAFNAGSMAGLAALPILLTSVVAGLVALGVAQYQIIKEEGELSKALALSGGALGLSKDAAITYAMSLNDMGISTSKGIEVLTQMAKAGRLTADETKMVAKAAVDMEKYAGVAIEETVKAFSKMKEKPVEALAELAIKTGMVQPEILALVAQLMEQGKVVEAAGVATKALADVTETQAARIREQLHPLEALYKSAGAGLTSLWNSIGNTLRVTDAEELESAYKRLNVYLNGNVKAHADAIQKERTLISQVSSRMRLATETARVEQLQSEYAAQFLEKQKLINEQEKIRAGLDQKKLTRMEAMDKAAEDARKRVKDLSEPDIARIRETAGLVWDKSKASEQNKAQNELNQALDKYADIQNKAIGVNSSFNNELKTLQFLQSKNKISTAEYAAEVKLLLAQQPYAIKAKKDEEDAVKALAKAQETYNDILGVSSGVSSDFNNKLAAIQLVYAETDMSAQAYAEAVQKLLEKQPYALKLLADEEKVRSELAKKVKEHADELNKLTEATDKYNHSLQKEYEALVLEKELMGLSEEDRTARLNILKVEQKYLEEVEAAQKAYNITFEEYMGLLDKAKANKDLGLKVVNEKADVAAIKKINDEYNKFVGNLAGAISQNIVEGGKDGSDKLRGIIEAELSKPITVFINAIIQDIFSENKSGKSFSERISSSQETFDVASKFSKFGFKGAELLSNMGFDTASEMLGQFSAGVKNASSMGGFKGAMEAGGANLAGAISGAVLNGLSGYSISKSLAGGYAIEGLNVDLIAGIASAIPGVGPIAGVIGGLFQRAFGMAAKEIKAQGITGTFSAISGAMVSQYTDWTQKGGWFRSDRSGRDISSIDQAFNKNLNDALASFSIATIKYADILGISADGVLGVTQAIDISLKDLTPEQQKKKIEEALTGFGDKLAQTLGFETQDALNKFAEQVMSQRNALELEYLKLQENSAELRKRERDTIHSSNLALYDRINLLKDLKDQENDAIKALEDRKRAESDAIDKLKEATTALESFKEQGKSIADWVAALDLSLNPTASNRASTQTSYMQDLVLAQSGDKTALGDITTSATSYLASVKNSATSSTEYRKAAALVAAQMRNLPVVKLWQDSVLEKLDALVKVFGSSIDSLISNIDTNGDNNLSALELTTAAAKYAGTSTGIKLSELIAAADLNSDGQITELELSRTKTLASLLDVYNAQVATTTSTNAVKTAQDAVKTATDKVASETTFVKLATSDLAAIQMQAYNAALVPTATMTNRSLDNDVVMATLLKAISDSNAKMASTPATSGSSAKGGYSAAEIVVGGAAAGGLIYLLYLLSDERTKQNITPYKTLDNGINLYDYNYKAPYSNMYGTDRKRGVLAQEIEQQYPAAVHEGANGMKMVDYSQLPIPRDMLKFANGAAFTNSIVSNPTAFNIGQMGEAGPEAIMPLQRMPNGALGVGSGGSNSSAVVDVLERLNANIEGMRSEVRADVTHNAKTARLLDRVIPDGNSIAVTVVV